MDAYNHVNGYASGASKGTNDVEAKELSNFIASITNNMDLDLNRVLVYEKEHGPVEKQNNKSVRVQQATVEFIDTDAAGEEDAPTLNPKTAIAKSKISDQIDLYNPVDTDSGDDFDFDISQDLNADDLGIFSILSSHLQDELEDNDKNLDQAYDEEVDSMFFDIYTEIETLSEEALGKGNILAAPKMAKFLTGVVTAKEMVGAGV